MAEHVIQVSASTTPAASTKRSERFECVELEQRIPQAQTDVGCDSREARGGSKSTLGPTEGNYASQSAGEEKGRAYSRGQKETF